MSTLPVRMTTHFFDRTAGNMMAPQTRRSIRRTAMMGPNGLYAVRTEERIAKGDKIKDHNAFAFPFTLYDSFTRHAAYTKKFEQAYEDLMQFEEFSSMVLLAGEHQDEDNDPAHIFNIDPYAFLSEPAFPDKR